MKKLLTLLLVSFSIFAFSACNSDDAPDDDALLNGILEDNGDAADLDDLILEADEIPFSDGPSGPPPPLPNSE